MTQDSWLPSSVEIALCWGGGVTVRVERQTKAGQRDENGWDKTQQKLHQELDHHLKNDPTFMVSQPLLCSLGFFFSLTYKLVLDNNYVEKTSALVSIHSKPASHIFH